MSVIVYVQNIAPTPILACVSGGATCNILTRSTCTMSGGKTIDVGRISRLTAIPTNDEICISVWTSTTNNMPTKTLILGTTAQTAALKVDWDGQDILLIQRHCNFFETGASRGTTISVYINNTLSTSMIACSPLNGMCSQLTQATCRPSDGSIIGSNSVDLTLISKTVPGCTALWVNADPNGMSPPDKIIQFVPSQIVSQNGLELTVSGTMANPIFTETTYYRCAELSGVALIGNETSNTVLVCPGTNNNCQNWTFDENDCDGNIQNFTTVNPNFFNVVQSGVIKGDDVCYALWDTGPGGSQPPVGSAVPNGTIRLPITDNNTSHEVVWNGMTLQEKEAYCLSNIGAPDATSLTAFYRNSSTNPISVCSSATADCSQWTFGNNPCTSNPQIVMPNPNNIVDIRAAPLPSNGTFCVASWVNPATRQNTDAPTSVITFGPQSATKINCGSIEAVANAQQADNYVASNNFTCPVVSRPTSEITLHNCYFVDMNVQIQNSTGQFINLSGSGSQVIGNSFQLLILPQQSVVRLSTTDGSVISGIFTVPVQNTNAFFRRDGTTNTIGCAATSSVKINSCYDILMNLQIMDTLGNWAFVHVGIQLVTIQPHSSNVTPLPQGGIIRLLSNDGRTTSAQYTIPSGAMDEIFFLVNMNTNTSGCPGTSSVKINNCNDFVMNLQIMNADGDWVPVQIDGQNVTIPASGSNTVTLPQGGTIRLSNISGGAISAEYTIPATTTDQIYFLADNVAASTFSCTAVTSVTLNNCFTVNMNLQILDASNNWVLVQISGTTVSIAPSGSSVPALPQGSVIRLINDGENIISGQFTVPQSSRSTVFFRSDNTVSTSSCTDPVNGNGNGEPSFFRRFWWLFLILVIIIIIIIIVVIIAAKRKKPEESTELDDI